MNPRAWVFPDWHLALWVANVRAHNTARRHHITATRKAGTTWWRVTEVAA